MIKYFICLLILINSIRSAPAQELIYPEIIPNTTPVEFELLYNSIQGSLIPKEKDEFLLLSHHLQNFFNRIDQDQLFFLIKSVIYKSVIQYEFDFYIQYIDVNSMFLKKVQQKLVSNKENYSGFSEWIIRSILGDLEIYIDTPLLDQLGQLSKDSQEDMKKIGEIERKLKYLRPWFYTVEKLKPKEFSNLSREISWKILYRIFYYARIMNFYSGVFTPQSKINFFKLPPIPSNLKDTRIEEFEEMRDDAIDKVLNIDQKEVLSAKEIMDKLGANPLETDNKEQNLGSQPVIDSWMPSEFGDTLVLPEIPMAAPQGEEW
jgi:hypothetical protein